MEKNPFIKICVIGIMILLLGAGIVTSTNGIIETTNIKHNKTEDTARESEKVSTPLDPPSAWIEQTKLLASDGAADDSFGVSVSISGDYAIVGAHGDDGEKGSAYVLIRDGTSWSQQTKLIASDGAADDQFGYSVSLDGEYALIGARVDDNNEVDSGSAYVFKRDGSSWSQQAKLIASDEEFGGYFGSSVSLDGDYALIGSPRDNGAGGADYGSAYVFKRDGSTWTEQTKLLPSDGGAIQDDFGVSVSISGDYALIGVFWDDDNGDQSGSAYVFKRDGTVWSEQAKLLASDGAAGDYFGRSVSLDEDYALIGAPDDHDDYGYAYIFKRDGSTWTEQEKFTASDIEFADAFGISVSLDGNTALIGSYGADEPEDSGSAYVFTYDGANWNEVAMLDASDETPHDVFGFSVSIDGPYALIGAFDDDDNGENSGSAYVFKLCSLSVVFLLGLISDAEEYTDEFIKFNPTFLIMFPSDKLIHTQGTIVIKNGYLGYLKQPLIFALGRAAIIN